MSYNGWTNYETWAVKLWLDNDEGSYREVTSEADSALDMVTEDDGAVNDDAFKYAFAAWLRERHDREADQLLGGGASVFSDLIRSALAEVNWHEIAGAYLEDAKEARS